MWHRQALRQDTCVLAVHIFDLIFFLQRFWSNNNNNTNNKDTARVTQADTDAKCQSIGSMYPYLSSYLFLQRFWSAHFTRTCFTDLLSWSILSLSAVKTLSPPSADKVSKLNLGSSENNLEQKIKFQIFHSKYVGLHPFVQIFYWSKFCFRSVQCDTTKQNRSQQDKLFSDDQMQRNCLLPLNTWTQPSPGRCRIKPSICPRILWGAPFL